MEKVCIIRWGSLKIITQVHFQILYDQVMQNIPIILKKEARSSRLLASFDAIITLFIGNKWTCWTAF